MKTSTIKAPTQKILYVLLIGSLLFMASCANESNESEGSLPDSELAALPVDSIGELLEEADLQLDTLTGNWLNSRLVDEIIKTGSPFYSQLKMLPIAEIIIDEETAHIKLIFGYNEACSGKFTRSGNNLSLEKCNDDPGMAFQFEYDSFKKELLLQADELTYKFSRMSTSPKADGLVLQQLVARQQLAGNWQSARAQKPFGGKLSFDEKGFVRGISSYNKYKFVLGYDSYPAFMDVVWLYRSANAFDPWYWQLDGDSLRFFTYMEEAPDMFEEQAVYYRLP
ncbi:MAG: hypothetical protein ACK417_03550 [Bacteroidia bacterium]